MLEHVKYLLESYRAGKISRREFIRRAMLFTGSAAVARRYSIR